MADIKTALAKNITTLRLKNKMTQSELAAKLNYTDKSVSKWENGDSVPPVDVLKDVADLFGVTVDFLITEKSEESFDKIYTGKSNQRNKIIITCLAVLIIWLLATIVFFYYSTIFKMQHPWLIFIEALPLSFIILIIFNGIWGMRKFIFILISCLIWTALTAAYLQYLEKNMWMVYLLGIPLQIATILWSQLKPKNKTPKK